MATLDIRDTTELVVDEILFYRSAQDNALSSIVQSPNRHSKAIVFKNCKDESVGYVAISDIDNLILALQKAKELWGGK